MACGWVLYGPGARAPRALLAICVPYMHFACLTCILRALLASPCLGLPHWPKNASKSLLANNHTPEIALAFGGRRFLLKHKFRPKSCGAGQVKMQS